MYFTNDKINDEINDKINDKIKCIDKQIMQIMSENSYITIPEIADKVSKSEPTVFRHLSNLIKKGLIERVGSRKTGYWKMK